MFKFFFIYQRKKTKMKANQVFYLALGIFVIQGGYSEGKKKRSSTMLFICFLAIIRKKNK